jgi:murein DD-endopeptidase MepM/ murein hydrolase activator NlpD
MRSRTSAPTGPLEPGARRRALAVLLTGLLGLGAVVGSWTAHAQVGAPGLPIDTTTTTESQPQETSSTTTTAPPEDESTTTTTEGPSSLIPSTTSTSSTTTTIVRAPGGDEPPPESSGPDAPPASPSTGDGGTAPEGVGPFPPELQALMNSIHRTPANNTKKLLFALSPLLQYGVSEQQAAVVGFGRFPVGGLASYSHDWWFPRYGPGWRLHQGTDIFAAFGTPVRAPVDGTVKVHNGGLGGLSVYVVQPDGTYWYLAHLAATTDGLAEGAAVKTGDVVGFVGDSGNARGGPPHLHFEVHPGGGGAIDPKAVLDQFITDALALAPRVVEAYKNAYDAGSQPQHVVLPTPAPHEVAAALPPRAALLWATAVSPTGGGIHLAEAEAARVASSIDWSSRELGSGPTSFDRKLARQLAAWWVQPLVHPLLARYLSLD